MWIGPFGLLIRRGGTKECKLVFEQIKTYNDLNGCHRDPQSTNMYKSDIMMTGIFILNRKTKFVQDTVTLGSYTIQQLLLQEKLSSYRRNNVIIDHQILNYVFDSYVLARKSN